MMKVAFAVLGIVLCAMAEPQVEIPAKFCSMSAIGTASLNDEDPFPCKMIRVRDTARYDFFADEQMTKRVGSIISRPDMNEEAGYGESYFWMTDEKSGVCSLIGSPVGMFSRYVYEGKSDEGLYRFAFGSDAVMFANDEGIVSEEFVVISVSINYTQVDYSYVHNEVDDAFSLVHADCSSLASQATMAISSNHCLNLKLPEYMCSVSANGTFQVNKETVPVKMYHVGNNVRFDIVFSEAPGSLLIRSDISDTTIFTSTALGCREKHVPYSLDLFKYSEVTPDGLEVFSYVDDDDNRFALLFNHTDSRELYAEVFFLKDEMPMNIIYSTVDYNYVLEAPDVVFTLTDDNCRMAATPAQFSKTSIQCSAPKQIIPTFPGCAVTMTTKLPMGESKALIMAKNNGILYEKIIGGSSSTLIRCDIKSTDHPGWCLYIERGGDDCGESWVDPADGYGPIEYYGEPEVAECPEGSTGECKKYCGNSYNSPCYTLTASNVVVQMIQFLHGPEGVLVNLTYNTTDAPTLADFDGTRCDGTVLGAPTEDPCLPEPSSHSSVTPGPSPAPGPQSSLTPSSASFSIPSILVVVAVLFAMF